MLSIFNPNILTDMTATGNISRTDLINFTDKRANFAQKSSSCDLTWSLKHPTTVWGKWKLCFFFLSSSSSLLSAHLKASSHFEIGWNPYLALPQCYLSRFVSFSSHNYRDLLKGVAVGLSTTQATGRFLSFYLISYLLSGWNNTEWCAEIYTFYFPTGAAVSVLSTYLLMIAVEWGVRSTNSKLVLQ